MGIRYEELYGSPPGVTDPGSPAAVTDQRTAQVYRVDVPRGTTPVAPIALPFLARTVLADNPSTYWYRVNGRWIPPWTIGATIVLPEPSAALTVATAEPEGYAIDTVGADLVLVASSADLDPSPGLFVPRSAPFQLQARAGTFDVSTAGVANFNWIAGPPAGQRTVVVELLLMAQPFTITGTAVRGILSAALQDDAGETVAWAAISPEQPSILTPAIRQPTDRLGLDLFLNAEPGSPLTTVAVVATYYEQRVDL